MAWFVIRRGWIRAQPPGLAGEIAAIAAGVLAGAEFILQVRPLPI